MRRLDLPSPGGSPSSPSILRLAQRHARPLALLGVLSLLLLLALGLARPGGEGGWSLRSAAEAPAPASSLRQFTLRSAASSSSSTTSSSISIAAEEDDGVEGALPPMLAPVSLSLPTSHRSLLQREQANWCRLLPYVMPREAQERSVRLGPSRGLSWRMHLLPHGRDIVSSEVGSQRGWENEKTRQMLRLMQGHRPRLNFTPKMARSMGPFVPTEQMGEEESKRLFVDAGANLGWFSLAMAAAGYQSLAFEPMQHNEVCLRSSLCRNPGFSEKVVLYNVGLGEAEGRCAVYSDSRNVGDGHLYCRDAAQIREAARQIAELEAAEAAQLRREVEEARARAEEEHEQSLRRAKERMSQLSNPAAAGARDESASAKHTTGPVAAEKQQQAVPAPKSTSSSSNSPAGSIPGSGAPSRRLLAAQSLLEPALPRGVASLPPNGVKAGSEAGVNRLHASHPFARSALAAAAAAGGGGGGWGLGWGFGVPGAIGGGGTEDSSLASQLRQRSLSLTRQWNTTGAIPRGYFVRNEVEVLRLDSVLPQNARVHVLKLDVEGFEARVLAGASRLFERGAVRFVLLEYSPRMVRDTGASAARDILLPLHRWGFQLRHVTGGFNLDALIEPAQFESFCLPDAQRPNRQCDVFAAREEEFDAGPFDEEDEAAQERERQRAGKGWSWAPA